MIPRTRAIRDRGAVRRAGRLELGAGGSSLTLIGGSENRVLIAGGGIAALEALLAIRDLTDGSAEIILLAPDREFTYRPLLVLEPFSPEPAARHDLPALVTELGASFTEGRLASVDADRGVAQSSEGLDLPYDRLLVATGARMSAALESAHTLWLETDPTTIDVLIDRASEREGLDLIVPGGTTWALPIYEFALMAARRLQERDIQLPLRVLTPEDAPLIIFGPSAAAEVAELLGIRGIEVLCGAWVRELADGSLTVTGSETKPSGYAVALPVIEPIAIGGMPRGEGGFVPIDPHARVRGLERVYAAGDGTDFPIKQGGLATQQADAAAESIAAALGAEIEPAPFRPVLRGKLLTGATSLNLRAGITGGEGEGVVCSDYLWWPPHKVSGRYLAPWLAAGSVPEDPEPPARAIEVEVALGAEWHAEPQLPGHSE